MWSLTNRSNSASDWILIVLRAYVSFTRNRLSLTHAYAKILSLKISVPLLNKSYGSLYAR